MKNVVGVTLPIYLLCRELERLEDSEQLEFSIFYSFAEILTSPHYTPGFDFKDMYYEIQYDYFDHLKLLIFPFNNSGGTVLKDEEILKLVKELKTIK
jgi:hypothetical protein